MGGSRRGAVDRLLALASTWIASRLQHPGERSGAGRNGVLARRRSRPPSSDFCWRAMPAWGDRRRGGLRASLPLASKEAIAHRCRGVWPSFGLAPEHSQRGFFCRACVPVCVCVCVTASASVRSCPSEDCGKLARWHFTCRARVEELGAAAAEHVHGHERGIEALAEPASQVLPSGDEVDLLNGRSSIDRKRAGVLVALLVFQCRAPVPSLHRSRRC